MGLRYQENMKVPFELCDVNSNIKYPLLLDYCLSVSGRQSAGLGRSNNDLLAMYGLIWIVTDYQVSIKRLPRFKEIITIETETLAYNKLFCYRKFRVYDENQVLLVDILAYFALLDPNTRKVALITEELVTPFKVDFVKRVQRSPKMHPLENPINRDYYVRYFDIDMNGHVNNSKYLDWMYDVLGYAFLKEHQPVSLTLKYIKEVSPGGHITSSYQLDHLTSYHQITSDGHLNAQAIIEWQNQPKTESEID
ncbi:acyl-ACP thioesterase domain-containing protein [Streptococcus castoreus]|uniref:acyl-[acyl-carrier-protein] thioesterase n=1 Tax=Streptococcus castoreus TaxID=254786 RepID=UPI00041B462A|nr:acyl-[acyl-carrier-protein] thioesterase [Streptococcus castoreus]